MVEKYGYEKPDILDNAYLWWLLEHARSLIARARELELTQYGITLEQMSVLHAIMIRGGSATIDEIANIIVRQHNSVSTIVNRMSMIGFTIKEKQQHGKKIKVMMTEKALALVASVPRKSTEMVFSSLSLNEKEQMAACLEQIIVTGHEILGHNFSIPFLTNKSLNLH